MPFREIIDDCSHLQVVETARRLTCFLSASVTRKDLQFGTQTDPSFQRLYFVLRHREVSRSNDLSAPPRRGTEEHVGEYGGPLMTLVKETDIRD